MVEVTVYVDEDKKSVGYRLAGHAGYDVSGKDIVCSAISMLVINTLNSIEQLTDDTVKYHADEKKGGLIEFKVTGEISDRSRVLLDSLELGLRQLKKNYSKYISITFKEV